MNNPIVISAEEQMKKVVSSWTEFLKKIRTGRANANMLNSVMVDFYGTPTPINQTGQISVPEPQQILVKPFDKSQAPAIVAGINKADLGLNPVADGDVVRISIPQLTEEIRKQSAKKMTKEAEQFRVNIRNARRDANDKIKKESSLNDDMKKDLENDIQKLTDNYISQIDKITKEKEKEIMSL